MQLLTKAQESQMKKNAAEQLIAQENDESIDFVPVVKLFNPVGAGTWF